MKKLFCFLAFFCFVIISNLKAGSGNLFYVDTIKYVKSDSSFTSIKYKTHKDYLKRKAFKDAHGVFKSVNNEKLLKFNENLNLLSRKINRSLDSSKNLKTFNTLNDAVFSKYYFIRIMVNKIIEHSILDVSTCKNKDEEIFRDYYFSLLVIDPITESVIYVVPRLTTKSVPEGEEINLALNSSIRLSNSGESITRDLDNYYTWYHYATNIKHIIEETDFKAAINKHEAMSSYNKITPITISKIIEPVTLADSRNAIVTLTMGKKEASGTIVSSDGYCIVNYSFVCASNSSEVKLDGKKIDYNLISYNHDLNLALIKLNNHINLKAIGITSISSENIGETVTTVGFDAGNIRIAKGNISALRQLEGITLIQTDSKVNSSMVGGALLNKNNFLAGIISNKAIGIDIEGIAFAISIQSIFELLNITVK